ncbi:phage tail protein [Bacillus thuringiensis]|uniref:phage tail domain-containing protein n=1 Tax=Bacillus thuringiensis TaxID=1428 RepID=UPI000BF350EE|nr:phage tail domain-containing protein [Bacillus thuringiensis]PFB88882.1 phage tail protein [Bacillus thuringiensis]
MHLIIQRQNGETFNTNEHNMRILDFNPESPTFLPNYQSLDGLNDGELDTGAKGKGRRITASILFYSNDPANFPIQQNKIYKIFFSKEPFYLIDTRDNNYRWLVRAETFEPKHLTSKAAIFDVVFYSANMYRESVSAWLKEFNNSSSFILNNPGDEYVDLRNSRQFFIIRFRGASTNLTIENTTTLQKWQYTGNSLTSDIIEMKYVRSTKSGISIFRDTNHQIISLAPGDNNFKITGASGVYSTEFRFRSYHI